MHCRRKLAHSGKCKQSKHVCPISKEITGEQNILDSSKLQLNSILSYSSPRTQLIFVQIQGAIIPQGSPHSTQTQKPAKNPCRNRDDNRSALYPGTATRASLIMATETASAAAQVISAEPTRDSSYNDFTFMPFLRKSFGFGLASDVPVCKAYSEGHCPLGPACPDRHPTPSRVTTSTTTASGMAPSTTHGSLVCKHFLKGLCKKGLKCEYLHEYNLRRMPECQSFSRSGYCTNGDDCLYQHVREEARLPPCEHYDRGYCELGPLCAKRHVRRRLCVFYLAGFCPDGKACANAHPRWTENLPRPTMRAEKTEEELEHERTLIREEQEREKEREREWRNERGRGGGFGRGRFRGRGRG